MIESHPGTVPPGNSFPRWLPGIKWLQGSKFGDLRADTIAGITLAAYLIPAAIGDASLARLPPQAGLYACLFGGLVFWLFCSARFISLSVTSAISLLIGASLSRITHGDVSRFAALATATTMLVGLIAWVAWLARAGAIVNFISGSVVVGFRCGVALFLVTTQLPKLFGFEAAHGHFWECARHFLEHLGDTNVTALGVGAGALVLLILGKLLLKHKPVALLVVIGGIAVASLAKLESHGVQLLGEVPLGLPFPAVPRLYWSDLNELLPLALACFLVGAVETASIGRMFCAKYGGRLDANQEFLALAAANVAAGLGQGFPVSGGTTQSLVNEDSGARTPLSGLVASVFILLVVLFLAPWLRGLPQPVLAAVVLMAVAGLFEVSALKRLWQTSTGEFIVAMACMLGVLGFGLLMGVLFGSIISLILLLRRVSKPHVAFLGRIPGTRRFSDAARHTDNELVPEALIFRVEGNLYYFNVDYVFDTVLDRVHAATAPLRLVLCDLSTSPMVDAAAGQMLLALHQNLAALNIRLQIVEAHASVRELLRAEGFEQQVGQINRFISVADAVDSFRQSTDHS